jgi:hypothetical protein
MEMAMNREHVIAAAKQAGIYVDQDIDGIRFLAMPESSFDAFYAIAFEAGKIIGVREYTTAKLAAQGITCYGGDNEAIRARGTS